MADAKITKREFFTALRGLVEGVEMVGEIPEEKVLDFIDTQVAQLDAKANKAREKAAENKAAGDALRAEVLSQLNEKFQTADKITGYIVGDNITKAKVVARLTQLVKSGEVEKELRKIDDRKVMCYRLANSETEE